MISNHFRDDSSRWLSYKRNLESHGQFDELYHKILLDVIEAEAVCIKNENIEYA